MADTKRLSTRPKQLAGNEPNPKSVQKGAEQYGRRFPVWPDLVYEELIAMAVWMAFLLIASIWLKAPLEEHSSPTTTPNPSKAPWYFLGLQELLVYFDPWIAGVMLPGLIIVGLMVLPYVDPNPEGVGEYSFFKRPFAVSFFTFGMFLWFGLIFIGMFLRGPSWQIYLPGEPWTLHKPPPAKVENLHVLLGLSDRVGFWLGLGLVLSYFTLGTLIPALIFKRLFKQCGFLRFAIAMFFVLSTLGVVGKIFLRLAFDVKYIWVTPWFNV